MRIKRKNAILIYLFTASLFLTSLWRFSNEEKQKMLLQDSDRLTEFSLMAENVYFNDICEPVLLEIPTFMDCILPLESGNITSDFGYRKDPLNDSGKIEVHNGIDISVKKNSEVYAIANGIVINAEYDDIGGNYIKISHDNGFVSYYGHLSSIKVEKGEEVSVGQVIGLSGESGIVTGPHLHFGFYYKNTPVDPNVYLDFETWEKSPG